MRRFHSLLGNIRGSSPARGLRSETAAHRLELVLVEDEQRLIAKGTPVARGAVEVQDEEPKAWLAATDGHGNPSGAFALRVETLR